MRQARKGLRPCRCHVPNSDARVIFVVLPAAERVPPLIFRLAMMCRNARSASFVSAGAIGSRTKINNSCECFAIRAFEHPLGHVRLGVRRVDRLATPA